jgi:hypothetical protein
LTDYRPLLEYSQRRKMSLTRTILAILIAASVAVLPMVGVFGFKLKSQDAIEISAVGPMHDCCPPAANPCDKTINDCWSMAACATKCFGYSRGVSTPLGHSLTRADVLPLLDGDGFRSLTASPPFRPPRV